MALLVCATPIGNLGDVTRRVVDALRTADLVLCEDTRHTLKLLRKHEIRAELSGLDQHQEGGRLTALLERLERGETLALVSDAGLPGLNDPGSRLIAAARAAGHEVTVLPGPTAVATALVTSGLVGERFTFVGFLPRRAGERTQLWEEMASWKWPVVAFESPRRLPASLASLAAFDPLRDVAVCRELTKLHEEVVSGSAAELAMRFSEPPRGEVTLVIGPPSAGEELDRAGALRAVAELVEAGAGRRVAARVVSELSGIGANDLYEGTLDPPRGRNE
jgi:16S rRNA (cytidine1402-2'-O)-methyltransferase